jgi:hypothetical protein
MDTATLTDEGLNFNKKNDLLSNVYSILLNFTAFYRLWMNLKKVLHTDAFII